MGVFGLEVPSHLSGNIQVRLGLLFRAWENGHSNGNGSRRSTGRNATQSQVRAIHAIANRQRIDLTAELRNRFDVDRPDDLGISQASELIDSLKATANGNGGRR